MTFNSSNLGILLTRPKEQSEAIQFDYRAFGTPLVIDPVISIKTLAHDCEYIDDKAVIITSQNAFPALKSIKKTTPIFCVGEATAQGIEALGFKVALQAPTAQSLLEALDPQSPYLYLSGSRVRLDFSSHLENCRRLHVYDTVPSQQFSKDALELFRNKDQIIIPVYSYGIFQNINKLLRNHGVSLTRIVLIAISNASVTSEKTLSKEELGGFANILIANEPNHKSILEETKRYLAKQDF